MPTNSCSADVRSRRQKFRSRPHNAIEVVEVVEIAKFCSREICLTFPGNTRDSREELFFIKR